MYCTRYILHSTYVTIYLKIVEQVCLWIYKLELSKLVRLYLIESYIFSQRRSLFLCYALLWVWLDWLGFCYYTVAGQLRAMALNYFSQISPKSLIHKHELSYTAICMYSEMANSPKKWRFRRIGKRNWPLQNRHFGRLSSSIKASLELRADHTGRNCFNLFQISFSANTGDTDPEVSGVSKDQKLCEKFKNTHCQVDHPAKIE